MTLNFKAEAKTLHDEAECLDWIETETKNFGQSLSLDEASNFLRENRTFYFSYEPYVGPCI